jgi:hypothetical protein
MFPHLGFLSSQLLLAFAYASWSDLRQDDFGTLAVSFVSAIWCLGLVFTFSKRTNRLAPFRRCHLDTNVSALAREPDFLKTSIAIPPDEPLESRSTEPDASSRKGFDYCKAASELNPIDLHQVYLDGDSREMNIVPSQPHPPLSLPSESLLSRPQLTAQVRTGELSPPSESSASLHSSTDDGSESDFSKSPSFRVPDAAEWRKRMVDRVMDHLGELFGEESSSQNCGGTREGGQTQSSSNNMSGQQQQGTNAGLKRSRDNAFSPGSSQFGANGEDDGDDQDRRPTQRPKSMGLGNEEPLLRRLACPLFQHDPLNLRKWPSCAGPGWLTVHRVN